MNWIDLFNCERLGGADSTDKFSTDRTSFQRDFDRIVFSSAFRRLQSKTQVFPLPKTDFIHTRLTHSLEASCVGRSLGSVVGQYVVNKNRNFQESNITYDTFASVVANACLAHDIGNPPFGHSGEDVISEYFQSNKAKSFLIDLSDTQKADFQKFEGNALGFRILTHTLSRQSKLGGGLELTYATLGAFTKYPKGSFTESSNILSKSASEKKFGFFDSERLIFEQVAAKTGLIKKGERTAWFRHPLAFLVEAADDICYRIMDLEDGVKLNLLPFKDAEELLIGLLEKSGWNQQKYSNVLDEREKLNYLRAKTISTLISLCADIFIANHDAIMNGEFDVSLIEMIPAKFILDDIERISIRKIYNYRKVIEIESAGFEILSGLLDIFLNAVLGNNTAKNKCNKKLIPEQFLPLDRQLETADGRYRAIMNIIQFISGMTDIYALDTYKSLKGISLPVY